MEPQVGDQFALLVTSVVDYAIFMLDPTGHIVTWNEGAQRIKGYKDEEIIGRHFSIFYPREVAESGKPDWELEVARRDGRYEEEGWRIRKDGTRFWASIVITPVRDEAGQLRGFGKVTRDLTESHLREMEREAVQHREADQLRAHAERMVELEHTKAEFLNLASHELRAPLTVVRGYNSMFADGSISGAEVPRIARVIEGKLAQMELLIQQMLETARLEYGDMPLNLDTVDLASLMSDQVEKFRQVAPRHAFKIIGADQEVLVKADRSRLLTVAANLLDNAIKFSPAGGVVVCTIGRRGSEAFVEVSDDGIGIAAEHIDLLFTRFGRLPTDENVTIPGIGLGLFLCREIARRHGGDISVTSTPGTGSEFLLTLPALA